jgi:hypothetical protein
MNLLRFSDRYVRELVQGKPAICDPVAISIAMVLVAKPQALCLNMRTSESSRRSICSSLRTVAETDGLTVCVSLQLQAIDDVWHCCDELVVLNSRGEVCFCGPKKVAKAFFKHSGYQFSFKTSPSISKLLQDICGGIYVPESRRSIKRQSVPPRSSAETISARSPAELGSSAVQGDAAITWKTYLSQRLAPKTRNLYYAKPDQTEFVTMHGHHGPSFLLQILVQLTRTAVASLRNFGLVVGFVLLAFESHLRLFKFLIAPFSVV